MDDKLEQAVVIGGSVAGIRPRLHIRVMNRYVSRVMAASTERELTRRRLLEVVGLTRPPTPCSRPGSSLTPLAIAFRRRPPAARRHR